MKIKFLKAFNGDSILLSFKDDKKKEKNILIDGGVSQTYKTDKGPKGKAIFGELKTTIDNIRENNLIIDLLIITHIDDDHIDGILKWFNEDKEAYKLIKEVWFNSGALIAEYLEKKENEALDLYIKKKKEKKTSIKQGIEFGKYIHDNGIWKRKIITQGSVYKRYGLEFKILSPNKTKLDILLKNWVKKDPKLKTSKKSNDYKKSIVNHIKDYKFIEDNAYPNGSSIAFILKHKKENFLFLGDSHPSVIVEGLKIFKYSEKKPIKAKYVKLSHHGSSGNTSPELLSYIKSNKYIISTNGATHQHPHKQLLSSIINSNKNCVFYFNYKERMNMIFSSKDKTNFPNFKTMSIKEPLK